MSANTFGATSIIQLPPDGAGKSLQTIRYAHIGYASGVTPLPNGTEITGLTSGAIAVIFDTGAANTTAAGEIAAIYQRAGGAASFVTGESIQVNGITAAVVAEVESYFVNNNIVVGKNNPHAGQFVDRSGAAYVRFQEGAQQLDAFGLTRLTTPSLVGYYDYKYEALNEEFWDDLVSSNSPLSATITHDAPGAAVLFDIGTASGEKVARTSNKYHLYQPGYSQLVVMTVASGDTGKANVRRRWGYFDEDNGVYFQLEGSTLSVALRSSVNGSPVVETVIDQADWKGDLLDGSAGDENLSGMSIDVSKVNIYWMDLQWLGAGRVRFGVMAPDGSRVTCHTIENANANTSAYMTTATLPVRWEIENTGVAGSPSRLKSVCTSVMTEGELLPDKKKRTKKWGFKADRKSILFASPIAETPLFAFRPRTTFNGIINRKVVVPEHFSIFVKNQAVIIRLYRYAVLVGASFADYLNSAVQIDTSATALNGGDPLTSHIYGPGGHHQEASGAFGYLGQSLYLGADGAEQEIWTLTAEPLELAGGSPEATVDFSISWVELS
jgi:hypothetical protein